MSKDMKCPKCGIEGSKISGQSLKWRHCRMDGVYSIYYKCDGCHWVEQNKRRWPCHRCQDQSDYTKDAINYPNRGGVSE